MHRQIEKFSLTLDGKFTQTEMIIIKDVPHKGRWKVVSEGYRDGAYICECSVCKETVWVNNKADRRWEYCPNCGAKMEDEHNGKEED